jgi:hypothetical protein
LNIYTLSYILIEINCNCWSGWLSRVAPVNFLPVFGCTLIAFRVGAYGRRFNGRGAGIPGAIAVIEAKQASQQNRNAKKSLKFLEEMT